MAKSFKIIETPTRAAPAADPVLAFVSRGQQIQHAVDQVLGKGPTARLSLDLPVELHARYKAACARARLKMTADLLGFIERRTDELEKNT